MNRNDPLPTSRKDPWSQSDSQVDLGTCEGKYPHSLFNKGVRTENEDHVGHIMKETNDKIVVFGHGNDRFDIPKSEINTQSITIDQKIMKINQRSYTQNSN
jgi:hypothetical protein